MKPKGYLAMILIAGVGIAAMAMYAPIKAAPGEVKLEAWELPLGEVQSELATMRKVLDSLDSQLKQLDGDHAGFREDLDSAGHRLDALESALESFSPPGPAARHDATSDGSDAQPVWLSFEEAQATGKPVLVHVTAKWCGPCQIFHSHYKRKAVIQSLDRFACVMIDADSVTPSGRRALQVWARGSIPYEVLYVGNERVWEGVPPRDLDSYIQHLEDLP